MTGFGMEETQQGFILRHGEVEMRMSKDEFFGLKAQLSLWTDHPSQFQEAKQTHPIAVDVKMFYSP